MTAARLVPRKEVERVYASLERAFLLECPEHAELVRMDLLLVPAPEQNTRGFALWEAFRLVWSAHARFVRGSITARAKQRGEKLPTLDDKLRNQAIKSMERAVTDAANAARLLAEDADTMEAFLKNLRGSVPGARQDAEAAQEAARHLAAVLVQLRHFRGVPQIRTRREWDFLISRTAARLAALGMPSRQVAALLTGVPEKRIDRAALERFRQRVRRLKPSRYLQAY